MGIPQPIVAKPGRKQGELVIELPAAWELRLRRVLRELLRDTLPDPREPGLTRLQRAARVELRRKRMQAAICKFTSDLLTAEIVGKEVALATRTRYGRRDGSLREHVQAILRDVAKL